MVMTISAPAADTVLQSQELRNHQQLALVSYWMYYPPPSLLSVVLGKIIINQ